MATFKPRARIIRTIGDHLISGPEAAVVELVKNSFDADSAVALIRIVPQTDSQPSGLIELRDNGHGMSRDAILNVWMEPATTDKVARRHSPSGRRMLGNKGIGRFAVARLGTELDITTTALNSGGKLETTSALFDWNWFTEEKYLSEIDIPIETFEAERTTTPGTTFRIANLRDTWTEQRINNVIRELRRIITPHTAAETGFQIAVDLSAFTNELTGFSGTALAVDSEELPLFAEAAVVPPPYVVLKPYPLDRFGDYEVRGKFDNAGTFAGTFAYAKGDGAKTQLKFQSPIAERPECGPISVSLNIYDGEFDSLRKLFERAGLSFDKFGVRAARRLLSNQAGVAIYRDGFRIRPYGDPDFDWLELERKRVQDPSRRLGLTQVAGRIEISDEQGSKLVERSSREGLERNTSYEHVITLLEALFLHVEERRFAFREKGGMSRRATGEISQLRELAQLSLIRRSLKNLPLQYQEPLQKAVDEEAQSLSRHLDALDEKEKLLQSRAAIGLVIAEVLHEGRRFLAPLTTAAKFIAEQAPVALEPSASGEFARKHLVENSTTVRTSATSLGRLFKRLDPIAGRKRGRPRPFSVAASLESALSLLSTRLSDLKIKMKCDDFAAEPNAYGFEEDLQTALLNLLDNATHWLATIPDSKREVRIRNKSTHETLILTISNTGPLIDEQYWVRLFEPGFSLRSEGHGLGLAISREALRASRGELIFLPEVSETTFVIRFPKQPTSQLHLEGSGQ